MESKLASDEKKAFSQRLLDALARANCLLNTTEFTDEYNLRADGASVTVYAARKWLSGEAIPTQEKLHVLAKWLHVSAEWLRFGDDGGAAVALPDGDTRALAPEDRVLLRDVHTLSPGSKQIVRDLVDALLRHQP